MICIRILVVSFALLASSQASWANLALTLVTPSNTFNVGDVGTVDVFIHSTNSPNDLLDAFLFELKVTGGSGVTFDAPQSETYLTDPSYVFAGRSGNIGLNQSATSLSNAGLTLTAADVSYDFTPATFGDPTPRVLPNSASPLLLGRFSFTAGSSGNYEISVDPSSSFSDVSFNMFGYTANAVNLTVIAVPEPSAALLAILGGYWIIRQSRGVRKTCQSIGAV